MRLLTPARSTAAELLDSQPPADAILRRNLREMATLYRLTGGLRLGWRAIRTLVDGAAGPLSLLDLAAGDGSVARRIAAIARRSGLELRPIISDIQNGVIKVASGQTALPLVQADARCGPWLAGQVDIVHCSQALHHFDPAEASAMLAEWARIARCGVVVVDLNRSWGGYLGARLAALGPLSPLGRHDGPLSVLRAYTRQEALALARQAGLSAARTIGNPLYWALIYPGQP